MSVHACIIITFFTLIMLIFYTRGIFTQMYILLVFVQTILISEIIRNK